MGWALMGQALMAPLGPNGLGSDGPGPHGRPLGLDGPGLRGLPWALMRGALLGWALMSRALIGRALMGPPGP